MSEEPTQPHIPTHPYTIAFIIDGEVVDLLRVHEHLGAALLSNPLIVDVTNLQSINVGDIYDETTKTFKDPLDD